jgi:hypothetical protein
MISTSTQQSSGYHGYQTLDNQRLTGAGFAGVS